ncbi:MAG: glycosyltransferase family 39 protein [Chloroflexi bacterium]|nr:glycosyltransferase family 39 protein [Chloroflexota bacterium]
MKRRHAWMALLVLLLLAASLRFHRLDAQSLWYDEGITAAHTARSLNELIPLLQVNVHTPAYFLLLAGWTDVAGDSEFALRLPSALFSILSVALAYALGARLYGRLAGVAAAALVALNSFSIGYAQEARMYAMLTSIAGVSMVLFIRILLGRGSRRRTIVAFGLVNALGLYTQVVFALVMLGQALASVLWLLESLLRGRRVSHLLDADTPLGPPEKSGGGKARADSVNRSRMGGGKARADSVSRSRMGGGKARADSVNRSRMGGGHVHENRVSRERRDLGGRALWQVLIDYVLANCLAVLLFLPWLPHSLQQVFSRPNRAQIVPPDEVLQLIAGHFAFGSNHALDMGGSWLAFGILLLAALLPLGGRRGWWRFLLPLAWLGISVVPYVSLELTTRYLRFLLPAQLAFALLLGRGVWMMWHRLLTKLAAALALGAILLTMLAGLDNFYHHSDFQRDDMRGLVQGIEVNLRPDDGIIFSAPGLVDLLAYYYRGSAPAYALPSTRDDDAIRSEVGDIIEAHDRLHVVLYGAREQDPRQVVEDTLNRQAFEISDRWVGDLRYLRYASPDKLNEPILAGWLFGSAITLKSYALNSIVLSAGDTMFARLIWSAQQPVNKRYKVALQLLDEAGFLVAQRDSEPAGGAEPTISWQTGTLVVDHHALEIPSDLPVGDYRLILGLYDMADPFARLPVDDADHVVLGEISVGSSRS